MKFHRRYAWEIIIFTLAFTPRIIFTGVLDGFYWPDEIDYDGPAMSIVNGMGYGLSTSRGPLYAFFLAGIYRVFGHDLLAVRILQSVLGATSAVLVMKLGKHFFGKSQGIFAGLLVAISPLLIYISGMLLSENVFMLLLLLIALTTVSFETTQKTRYLILCGVTLGFASLCRPAALAIVFPALAWVYLATREKKNILKNLFLVCLSICITLVPWTLRNYLVHRSFILIATGMGRELWFGNNPEATGKDSVPFPKDIEKKLLAIPVRKEQKYFLSAEAKEFLKAQPDLFNNIEINKEREKVLLNEAIYYMSHHALHTLGLFLRKCFYFWRIVPTVKTQSEFVKKVQVLGIAFYAPIFLSFTAGIYFSVPSWKKYLFLYILIATYTLTHALFTVDVRYRIPIEPYIFLFASSGITRLVQGRQ